MTGRHGRSIGLLAALMLLVGALAGCGTASTPPSTPPPLSSPSARPHVDPATVKPTAIRIPSIHVDGTGFVPLGIQGQHGVPVVTGPGELEVPDVHKPMTPGWWTGGSAPGFIGNPTVIVGHVDGDHKHGLFYDLHSVKVGDKVEVDRNDGMTVAYSVYRVQKVDKEKFPSDSFYGPTAESELHLATCGGRYDAAHHRYLDNWLVYAKFASSRPTS